MRKKYLAVAAISVLLHVHVRVRSIGRRHGFSLLEATGN